MESAIKIYTDFLKTTSKTLRLYFSGVFFSAVVFTAYNVFFKIYLKNLGWNEKQIGLIIALITIGMAAGAFFGASASIRLGKKKTLITGQLIMIISANLMINLSYVIIILFGSFLFGLGYSFIRVFNHPIIFQNTDASHRITAFSFVFIIMNGAAVFSNFIGGNISGALSRVMDDVFANQLTLNIFCDALIIAILLFSKVSLEEEEQSERPKGSVLLNSLENYKEVFHGKTALYILQRSFTGFGAGLIVPFFPLYIKYMMSVGDGITGNILAITQVGTALGGLIVPALARKHGSMKTVIACQLLSIPFMVMIALPNSMMFLVVALFARSMLMNMTMPVVDSLSMGLVEKRLQVFLSSLMRFINLAMRALGSFVGGFMMYEFGYNSPYPITIGAYIIGTIIFYFVFRSSSSTIESEEK